MNPRNEPPRFAAIVINKIKSSLSNSVPCTIGVYQTNEQALERCQQHFQNVTHPEDVVLYLTYDLSSDSGAQQSAIPPSVTNRPRLALPEVQS